ncbi:protein kinase domain-containing protein [Tuwongella immobilis]|uniref:Protein kinase domain-containing protein n=1 Tax=Tuwongella immobilis TaxID=692036 RepID=A0A6C2YPX4_9BACT|nr:protein kinase [Tuwongella immobilis]VIP03680.1 serine threonine protein kinase : Serine/threonine protein kinase OS=Pirellula staleyi (strain ATCC 27377 / DSM 6068 / ICPB 4128) GN=Psta_2711 PE=3 SV=1: Pkinase: Isochorismatase [Tuwongella immobilis]VTS04728.1 serine threonine protein kinase : Serine/threonine protein kinase OS=Pirellula staleyi (strain ATCC 27377 / DSM 6068 / ICPB 4128) GN=Psta_2711 PE=3 SV=1: Pkinase: Isochorismatase [Tuwongella immobilis]
MSDDFLDRLPRDAGHPRIGSVILGREIGRGAMGAVFSGWDCEAARPVAVKFLLNSQHASPDRIHRFRREGQLLALLNDPSLIELFDHGFAHDVYYLIMEWVPGRGLDHIVGRVGPMLEHEVVTILRDVGQALLVLSTHGIVHRDIKPSNLLLRSQDGRIKIADLGIAKSMERMDSLETVGILGTPAFMSPEQIREPGTVSLASDLFSLGMTAYFLLTRQTPFVGKTAYETMQKVCSDALPHPRKFGISISDSLWETLVALTEKSLEQRIQQSERLFERLPTVSMPFRSTLLDAARPSFEPSMPDLSSRVGLRLPTLSDRGETDASFATSDLGTAHLVPPESAIRSLLFCQCLQNDFIAPEDCVSPTATEWTNASLTLDSTMRPLPNRLHVGWQEATRLVGEVPAQGPLVSAVSQCAEAEHVGMLFIRDWHDASDPKQHAEMEFFGPHCLMGTWGARFIDVLEAYSRDRRRTAVIDSTGINDCADTPILDLSRQWIAPERRATVPVGVIGVWTNVKIHYLLYDLKTRGGFHNLATCSALVASPDQRAHLEALRHFASILNVKVFDRIDDFLQFLGVNASVGQTSIMPEG